MPAATKVEERFIRQGFKSYLAVLESVKEFERRIASHCQEHLVDQLPTLRDVIGIKFDSKRIKSYPPKVYEDGAYIEVGVQNAVNYFSVGIWFGKEGNKAEPMVYAAMYCPSKQFANTLYAQLEARGFSEPEEWEDGWYISADEPMKSHNTQSLQRALKIVLNKWISIGRKVRDMCSK